MNQPELIPTPSEQTITVKAEQADAAVARIRRLGGVLLSFSAIGGGKIEMHIILDATLISEALDTP